jgi:hypothetical protein
VKEMGKEKHIEIVKSGDKEYVYELKCDNPVGCVLTGPSRELKEVRTVKEK